MKPRLKTTLISAMEDWVIEQCEHEERPEIGFIHTTLGVQMANAAEAVYDATFSGQEYAQKN